MRDDLVGVTIAPKDLQAFMTKVGGKNPYREPLYRLVWAEARVERQGGMFSDWDEGLALSERGGLAVDEEANVSAHANLPIRTVAELRTVKKYPGITGWLLERWMPAHFYGSQEFWYEHKVPGFDIPLLGPYPEKGDYEATGDLWLKLPAESQVREAIQAVEDARENHKETLATRVRKRVYDAEERERKAGEAHKEFARAYLKEHTSPLWGSSLAAGRLREEMAARLRARGCEVGHVGN